MERLIDEAPRILKNPFFLESMPSILERVDVEYVVIPMRNFEKSAQSRERYRNYALGGFWNASTCSEQIEYYHKLISEYILLMAQHDIPTIFLDFERMVNDPVYLYQRLSPLLIHRTDSESESGRKISFDEFVIGYHIAHSTSRPTRQSEDDPIQSVPVIHSIDLSDSGSAVR